MGEAVVFGAALIGEQDPERVDTEGGAERRMEQRDDAENDGSHARPGQMFEQAPADYDAAGGDDEECAADDRQDKRRDETPNIVGGGDADADDAADDHQDDTGDDEERTGNDPQDP